MSAVTISVTGELRGVIFVAEAVLDRRGSFLVDVAIRSGEGLRDGEIMPLAPLELVVVNSSAGKNLVPDSAWRFAVAFRARPDDLVPLCGETWSDSSTELDLRAMLESRLFLGMRGTLVRTAGCSAGVRIVASSKSAVVAEVADA